jgi:hypothetical protein
VALPAIIFITRPTKKPNSVSRPSCILPPSRHAQRGFAVAATIAPVSVIWRSPFSVTAAASLPVSIIDSNTSLAMRPLIVPSAIRSTSAARPACRASL